VLRPNTVLQISGRLTSATTGAPVTGGRVELVSTLFVITGVVETASADAGGEYSLRHETFCGSDRTTHGYYLRASAPGHESLTNINLGTPLLCSSGRQRVDFAFP
jgi:hypothetical protein